MFIKLVKSWGRRLQASAGVRGIGASRSQPQAIELDLPICHHETGLQATEVLDAEQIGPNLHRLVYSPGMVEGPIQEVSTS